MPDPELTAGRAGQILIGDRNYFGADFEAGLAGAGLTLLRPARKGEAERAGSQFFKPLRQTAESIFDTYCTKTRLTSNDTAGERPPES